MLVIFRFLFFCVFFMSCRSAPSPETTKPQARDVSIAYLKSLYRGYPYVIDEDISIEGVLRSTDTQGNFYKTVVIEDQTGGIDLKIDLKDIFLYFERDRKYTVRCNGLTLGSRGGTIELGSASSDPKYQVDPIPEDRINSCLIKISDEEYPLQPFLINVVDLTERHISCWMGFLKVQFIDEEVGLAWTQNGENTERHLIDIHEDTLHIHTNINTDYSEHQLPVGSGCIYGILGYFNQNYQIRITTLYYVIFEEPRFVPKNMQKKRVVEHAQMPLSCGSKEENNIPMPEPWHIPLLAK